jgi:hypothetical protein
MPVGAQSLSNHPALGSWRGSVVRAGQAPQPIEVYFWLESSSVLRALAWYAKAGCSTELVQYRADPGGAVFAVRNDKGWGWRCPKGGSVGVIDDSNQGLKWHRTWVGGQSQPISEEAQLTSAPASEAFVAILRDRTTPEVAAGATIGRRKPVLDDREWLGTWRADGSVAGETSPWLEVILWRDSAGELRGLAHYPSESCSMRLADIEPLYVRSQLTLRSKLHTLSATTACLGGQGGLIAQPNGTLRWSRTYDALPRTETMLLKRARPSAAFADLLRKTDAAALAAAGPAEPEPAAAIVSADETTLASLLSSPPTLLSFSTRASPFCKPTRSFG